MDYPVFAPNGNRVIGAARITIGTGGLPTGTPSGGTSILVGGIGFAVSRGATGVYTLAYPAQRDLTVQYAFQAQSGALSVQGATLNNRPSGVATGLGSFVTRAPAGTVLDPAPGDVISIFFYATDSDAY